MPDPATPPRVLVVGGAGVFGERLVIGLLETTAMDVVVAGRDEGRLAALARRRPSPRLSTLRLDARHVTAETLRIADAFALVDAAGPFQGADYSLAKAAIAAGMHYLDLADARDFVAGFAADLDAAAKRAGVVAITGASSTPALSNAALDRLTAGWRHVDRVHVAISPGNRAPRGLSVVRAILFRAGQRVRVFVDGEWRWRPAWGMTVRRDLPGIGGRWLGLAETPDLDIIPTRFRVRRTVLFRAGLELSALHLGLLLATLPVRLGLVSSLAPLARPAWAVAGWFERLGSDRGGMLVEAEGIDRQGAPVRARWSLVAEAGDGPSVPTLPALAVLRGLQARRIAPGAAACVGVLSLEELQAEFAPHRITTAMAWDYPGPSLYERVLGQAFDGLPEKLRELHRPGWGVRAQGMARVEGAEGLLARLTASVFRLPPAAEQVPITVDIVPDGAGRERWRRDFGGRRFASTLSAARAPGRVVERFGPLCFELGLPVGSGGVLGMPVLAWRIGPLRLPLALAPVSSTREYTDAAGRFAFDVELRLPLGLGRLTRYRGWLATDASGPPGRH